MQMGPFTKEISLKESTTAVESFITWMETLMMDSGTMEKNKEQEFGKHRKVFVTWGSGKITEWRDTGCWLRRTEKNMRVF